MKNKNASNLKLAAITMTMMLMTACWEKLDKTLKIYQLIGTVALFLKICKSFARITAGTCGFYGLTRVGWLLVNEDHNCGTAFIMSIIGFFCCTIAVGLLPS